MGTRSDLEDARERDFMGLCTDAASCAEAHRREEITHMYNVDPDAIAMVKSSILDAVRRPTAGRWLYNCHLTNSLPNGIRLAVPAMGRPDWSNTGGRQQLFSFNSSQEQKLIKTVHDAYQIMHAKGHSNTVLNSAALSCNLPANSLPDHSWQGMKVFPFVAPISHVHTSTMSAHQTPTPNGRALAPFLVGGAPSTRMLPAAPIIKPSSTQLTIFYAGKVNVYNDVSSIKAKEIMLMAAAGKSLPPVDMFNGTSSQMATPPVPGSLKNTDPPGLSQIDPSTDQLARDQVGIGPGPLPASIPQAPQAEEGSMPGTQTPYIDNEPPFPRALPLARKASLTRFLEKRKERVLSKSPYPVEKTFF